MARAEHAEATYELIEWIIDVKSFQCDVFVEVKWLDLPDEKDWTWQPLEGMNEDVPEMLIDFLNKTKKKKVAK